jgi:hypothetical protein
VIKFDIPGFFGTPDSIDGYASRAPANYVNLEILQSKGENVLATL